MTGRVPYVLFGLVFMVFVVLRFARPDLMFLGQDEATLFLMVDHALETGTWPSHGLVGTKGLFYGPVPVSIFILLQKCLGDARFLPEAVFYFNAALQLGSLIFLMWSVMKILSKRVSLFVFSLAMTSPHLLLYLRSAWDNPYLIVWSNLIGGLICQVQRTDSKFIDLLKRGPWLSVLFGILLAFSIGTHLMALPLVLAVVTCVAFIHMDFKRAVRSLMIVAVSSAVPLIPYFYDVFVEFTSRSVAEDHVFKATRYLTGLRDVIAQWGGRSSWSEFIAYYASERLQQIQSEIFRGSEFLGQVFYLLSRITQVVVAMGIVVVPFLLLFRAGKKVKNPPNFSLIVICAVLIVFHIGMAVVQDAVTHPHYLQAVWWVPFLLAIILFSDDFWSKFKFKGIFEKLLFGSIVVNLIYAVLFSWLVIEKNGYPTSHLGASLSAQRSAMATLCAAASSDIPVDFKHEDLPIAQPNVYWLFAHESNCSGKRIIDSPSGWVSSFGSQDTAEIEWIHD